MKYLITFQVVRVWTLTYTIRASDSNNPSSSDDKTITITINGSNDAPVISVESNDSDSKTLNESDVKLTTSGTLSVSDLDLSNTVSLSKVDVVTSGVTTGLASNNSALLDMLSLDSGNVISNSNTTGTINWSFDSASEIFNYLSSGESLTLTYTIRASDSNNPSSSDDKTITITINGSNDAPVISVESNDSDSKTLNESDVKLTTSGTLSVSDLDLSEHCLILIKSWCCNKWCNNWFSFK